MGKSFWVGPPGFGPSSWTAGAIHPHVDITETSEGIQVYVELAGVSEQDINLSMNNGMLIVYGEKRPHNQEEWERSRYLAERAFGTFRRTINLPYGLDDDASEADFTDGVLTVRIPWAKEAPPSSKKVLIKPRKTAG